MGTADRVKFREDYIVRRDAVGIDDGKPIYEYDELDARDVEILNGWMFHIGEVAKWAEANLPYAPTLDIFDYAEMQFGPWKFWFDREDDEGKEWLLNIVTYTTPAEQREYVFMSPGEYENTFRA